MMTLATLVVLWLNAFVPVRADVAIAGIALDDQGHGVDRALVGLRNLGGTWERTAVSRDDGSFDFAGVPDGDYTLAAVKTGYVNAFFAQPKPGRPGAIIRIAGGSPRDITLRLVRCGVIAGIVRDGRGDVRPGVRVQAVYLGEAQVTAAGFFPPYLSAVSNDHGEYRIFSLMPGEYLITAGDTPVEMHQRDAAAGDRVWVEPPVYFPDTTRPAEAQPVLVHAGEERVGIDLRMRRALATRVSGSLTASDGQPAPGANVRVFEGLTPPVVLPTGALLDGGRVDSNVVASAGQFTLDRLTAGTHTIVAQVTRRASRLGDGIQLWGTTTVSVDGVQPANASVVVQPGASLSGRIVFEGEQAWPASRRYVTVGAVMLSGLFQQFQQQFGSNAERDGRFTIQGLPPGAYGINVKVTGSSDWVPLSAMASGQDLFDSPFEIQHEPMADVVITMTDKPARLSGTVSRADGTPVFQTTVVAFSTDKRSWTGNSRRVLSAVPNTDGQFEFVGLPPGDYFVTTTTGDWTLKALPKLSEQAKRITVVKGKKGIVDLRGF